MERRDFLTKAAVGTAAVALTAACADETKPQKKTAEPDAASPAVTWRMPSSFPQGDGIYNMALRFADRVRSMTSGKFDIQVFPPGDLMPAMGVLDATQSGTVQCCYTSSYYFADRDKAFVLGTGFPFCMNARQFNAWWYEAGGRQLLDEFYAKYNVKNFLVGNTGAQMGGWFKKEVKTMEDFKGLRIRIAGIAADVLAKFGASPISTPGGDIAAYMERGDLDAAEYVGPYEDAQLGLQKTAKYYYYPGWWEPASNNQIFVNVAEWNKLSKNFQDAFEAASVEINTLELALCDTQNPIALDKMTKEDGVELRPFSDEILMACYKATREVYDEESAKNPEFAKLLKSQDEFQRASSNWFSLVDSKMDDFMQKTGGQV